MSPSPGRRGRTVIGLLAVTAVLSACSTGAQQDQSAEVPDYDPVPSAVDEPASAAESEGILLPYQLQSAELVEPGWDAAPRTAEGVFLAPVENEGLLTFTAADDQGRILWEAERPVACSGFTLTHDGDRALAVLTDLDTSDEGFGSTATAYDLHTGEQVWGPVEVPGPHQGPGTVFAEPPEESMGQTGPKMVLDPQTGDVIVDESRDESMHVLGEYQGTVLLADQTHLHAYRHGADSPEWSLDLATPGWEAEEVFSDGAVGPAPLSAALVGTDPDDLDLLDLQTGEPIVEGVREASQDPQTGTWITLGEDFSGHSESGEQLFTRAEGQSLQLQSTAAVMAFLRTEQGGVQVHNVVTGDIAQAYDPDGEGTVALPVHISAAGAGVLQVDDDYLLAPVQDQAPDDQAPEDGAPDVP